MKKLFFKQNKACPAKLKRSGGFTIIETMIAVSLFVVIAVYGMGTLLNANLLRQKSQSMRSIMDNLSFVMEDMSRNLRTGYNYRCLDDSNDLNSSNVVIPVSGQGCWGVAFEYQYGDSTKNDDQWVYYINTNGIFKSTQGPYTNPSINYSQLNPNEVIFDTVASGFSILGAEPPPGDSQQPFVIIKLVGKIVSRNIETPFSLQTSASQRLIDISI